MQLGELRKVVPFNDWYWIPRSRSRSTTSLRQLRQCVAQYREAWTRYENTRPLPLQNPNQIVDYYREKRADAIGLAHKSLDPEVRRIIEVEETFGEANRALSEVAIPWTSSGKRPLRLRLAEHFLGESWRDIWVFLVTWEFRQWWEHVWTTYVELLGLREDIERTEALMGNRRIEIQIEALFPNRPQTPGDKRAQLNSQVQELMAARDGWISSQDLLLEWFIWRGFRLSKYDMSYINSRGNYMPDLVRIWHR